MIQHIEVEGLGRVRVSQRQGTRSFRISIHQHGEVRLSLPPHTSITEGIKFLQSKKPWILQHRTEPAGQTLISGARIGHAHTLQIIASPKKTFRSYVTENRLVIYAPTHYKEPELQSKVTSAAKKLLQQQAEKLLPQRVSHIATTHSYKVRSVQIKSLQSRWGSCSSNNELVFTTFLMQLPWRLIDYVIYHELAHTKHHNHSTAFWQEVAKHLPDYKERRRQLKKFPTVVFDASELFASVS